MGLLTKIYTTINNHIIFDSEKDQPPVKEQKAFLASLPEPADEYELSYNKYRCLLFCSYTKRERFRINFICFFALGILIAYYRLRGLKYDRLTERYQPKDLLLRKATKRIPISDIYPDKLENICSETAEYDRLAYGDLVITKDAFSVFRRSSALHPFNFHYRMVVLIRLAQACSFLVKYRPKVVSTYVCEREFSDPLLTMYFESHGVQYHGFMHGDYLFSIQFAFMHYSKYWVWNEHYRRMFESVKCDFQTEVYLPKKCSGIVKPRERIEDYDYYATYYFSDETKISIELVKEALCRLKEKGLRCKVRPHPRFSDKKAIQSIFGNEFEIEDPSNVSIESSLENSYLTIALVSTVLSQAYYSHKKIVIDDISNPERFKELYDRDYILIDKADYFLSELV